MKINYEDIITKANARKEAIAKFASLAVAAEHHATTVINSLLYFQQLGEAAEKIDAEGKALLGEPAQRAQYIGGRAKDVIASFSANGPNTLQLGKLLEALQ